MIHKDLMFWAYDSERSAWSWVAGKSLQSVEEETFEPPLSTTKNDVEDPMHATAQMLSTSTRVIY